jgi:hypothetical protein
MTAKTQRAYQQTMKTDRVCPPAPIWVVKRRRDVTVGTGTWRPTLALQRAEGTPVQGAPEIRARGCYCGDDLRLAHPGPARSRIALVRPLCLLGVSLVGRYLGRVAVPRGPPRLTDPAGIPPAAPRLLWWLGVRSQLWLSRASAPTAMSRSSPASRQPACRACRGASPW